jgi:hypothetical protein
MTKGIKIKVGNLPTFYLLVPFREKQSEIEKSQDFFKKEILRFSKNDNKKTPLIERSFYLY